MRWASLGLFPIALAFCTAATAAEPGERLVSPALAGFVLGYSAGNAGQSIREEVPRGETVQAWTRMVTTQRFGGLAGRASPAEYARNVVAPLPRQCPGAKVSPITNLTVSGRAAARFQVDCPRSAGGKPESFILLAIAGRSDMHVKQVAFRGGASAADLAWGRNFLAKTVLCAAGDKQPACR